VLSAHHCAAPAPQIDKCFGFETSVERSQGALMAAKVEARSTRRGIGLVKLMGRSSGFITMQASMASGEAEGCQYTTVQCCLQS
jgi:6-phosphofructokinase 1